MEEIIITMLTNLGLGINGVIGNTGASGGIRFVEHLNNMTQHKFEFTFVNSNNYIDGNKVYVFKTNNGLLFTYTTNENGKITNIAIAKV